MSWFGMGGPVFPTPGGVEAGASNFAAQQQLAGVQAQAAAQKFAAQQQAGAQRYSAQQSAGAQQYAANTQLQGLQSSLAQSQGRWNQVFPFVSGVYGQLTSGGGLGGGAGGGTGTAPAPPAMPSSSSPGGGAVGNYGYGGGVAAPPQVPTPRSGGGTPPPLNQEAFRPSLVNPASGPVVSPDLLNQQINASQAQNTAAAQGQVRRQTQDLAGRGLGSASPLAQAIQAQIYGQNLGANSQSALQARTNAAQLNSQYAQGLNQASINAAAQRYAAAQAAQGSMFGALQGAQASQYGSQVDALSRLYGAQAGAQAQLGAAGIGAGASTYNAGLGYLGSTYGAGLDYQASLAQTQASKQNALLQALAQFSNV